MEWYEKAAHVTEMSAKNTRYSASGFAKILQKYDADKSKTLDATETASLLNAMLKRYNITINKEQAHEILSAYTTENTISIQEFSTKTVGHRNKGSETYTRLLSNILSKASGANINCILQDPFQVSAVKKSPLQDHLCVNTPIIEQKLPGKPHATAIIQQDTSIRVQTSILPMLNMLKIGSIKNSSVPVLELPKPLIANTETKDGNHQAIVPESDPFAGLVSGGNSKNVEFLTEHDHEAELKNKTALEIWNHIQEEGACSGDHCALVPKPVQDAIYAAGKNYNPLIHVPESSDARDAEIAKALGANIGAQFENKEVLAQTFDLNRSFNPAPVMMYDHFAQSPTLGFYKGALAKKQRLRQFIEAGSHNETTHFDTPAERIAVRTDTQNGMQIAGVHNVYLSDKGSVQLSAVAGKNAQSARLDVYRAFNKNGTLGVGGTLNAGTQKNADVDNRAISTRQNNIQATPMIYKTSVHSTTGVGLVLENNEAPKLRTDFSMLDWWNARNAFRVVSDINKNSVNIGVSIVNETSHFARPTYEIAYGLSAQRGLSPMHTLAVEYKKPLSVNHGVYFGIDAITSLDVKSASLQIGSLHAFGKNKNWAIGPNVQLTSMQGQALVYTLGASANMLNIRSNISLQLDAGVNMQNGQSPKPNAGFTLQYTGFSDALRKKVLQPTQTH